MAAPGGWGVGVEPDQRLGGAPNQSSGHLTAPAVMIQLLGSQTVTPLSLLKPFSPFYSSGRSFLLTVKEALSPSYSQFRPPGGPRRIPEPSLSSPSPQPSTRKEGGGRLGVLLGEEAISENHSNGDLKSLLTTVASAEPIEVKDTALENTPGSTRYPFFLCIVRPALDLFPCFKASPNNCKLTCPEASFHL